MAGIVFLTMLTREQLESLLSDDRDAFFALVLALQEQVALLQAQIAALTARVQELEALVNKDSHNSSKPPSSDGLARKPAPVSLRKKSGKRPGGQPGRHGCTLEPVADPRYVIVHAPQTCSHCGGSLDGTPVATEERRQVFDLPPLALEATEHRVQTLRCACGCQTRAEFPEGVTQRAQYGPRIKALAVYLQDYQLLPYQRTSQLLLDLFGASISPFSVQLARRTCAELLAPVTETIKEALIGSPVVHFDETGMRVEGRLHWLHSAGTETLTYYTCHPNRGRAGSDAGGILPVYRGTALHDGWCSYETYCCAHGLCNAHHLRELTGLQEQGQAWAADFATLLLDIHDAVAEAKQQGRSRLPALVECRFEARYDRLLATGYAANPPPENPPRDKRGRPKQTPARNLLRRLDHKRAQVLAFMYDFTVPFTNNLAERDLRMVKVKQKVSGGFRNSQAASDFCHIRGYISTMAKQGQNLFNAIRSVFNGNPVQPELAS